LYDFSFAAILFLTVHYVRSPVMNQKTTDVSFQLYTEYVLSLFKQFAILFTFTLYSTVQFLFWIYRYVCT